MRLGDSGGRYAALSLADLWLLVLVHLDLNVDLLRVAKRASPPFEGELKLRRRRWLFKLYDLRIFLCILNCRCGLGHIA